jgi:uncharacterized protein involved in outer membrane biogenesis
MGSSLSIRAILTWILAGVALLLLAILGCTLAIDAGLLRRPLIALLVADTHRPINVDGSLEAHLFSRHPHLVAQHVRIGNPSWMAAGITASVDRLTLDLAIPGSSSLVRVEGLMLEGATLSLVRNADGHANWQLSDLPGGDGPPLIRRLSMPQAHATLSDARRHLAFEGVVSADSRTGADGLSQLRISGSGELNQVKVEFETLSDPLASASRQLPYHFSFSERSRSSHLSGRGSLARAFDFDHLQTAFTAAGANLKDLYALVGVSLVNTGDYQLSGTLERRDALSTFNELSVTSGMSDVSGTLSVDSSGDRPRLSGELHARVLRLADLGVHAPRHESADARPSPLLLSDSALDPDALRHGEANFKFSVASFEATRLALHKVSGTLTVDHGILALSPLTGEVLDGKFSGRWQLDATSDDPLDAIELNFKQLQIGHLDHPASGNPRFDAQLNASVSVTGHGSSLHQIGASANGSITARLLNGTLRQSLVEMSGLDMRAVGLMLSRNQQQAQIQCGAANFQAHDGTLSTDDLLVETDAVRITGAGSAHLDTEALHLELQGHPKQTRLLRVKAPLLIEGTLLHPHGGLGAPKSLRIIDPGSSRTVDCASLLAN